MAGGKDKTINTMVASREDGDVRRYRRIGIAGVKGGRLVATGTWENRGGRVFGAREKEKGECCK